MLVGILPERIQVLAQHTSRGTRFSRLKLATFMTPPCAATGVRCPHLQLLQHQYEGCLPSFPRYHIVLLNENNRRGWFGTRSIFLVH